MKSKKVKLLYPFTNSTYQSFLQDMADSLVDYGIEKIEPLPIKWNVRHIAAKLHICRNFPIISKKNALIVLGGGYIDASSFPFCFNHEIIPVLWDTWPRYWDEIVKSFKRHNVRLAFFTQKQTADFVKSKLPTVECVHLPEGIKAKKYIRPVKQLKDRPVDVLEMGRIYQSFHSQAVRSNTIVKYAPNIVLIMNIGFIAAAFLSLINYKKDKAFLLFISLCIQLLFINNSYFEKKTNVFMMSSAYIGIFSALMSLDE